MTNSDEPHCELVARARAGDGAAMAELFDLYRQKLRSIVAFRMDPNLRGRIDPSDVIQESYLDLAKRLGDFGTKNNMSFFVWSRLVTIERLLSIHRAHISAQKRDARRELSIDQDVGVSQTSVSLAAGLLGKLSSASGKAVRAEQKTKLHEILGMMHANEQEIIALRIFEGLSNGEAAEVLSLTKQTASKRFLRSLEQLRDLVRDVPGLEELFSNE